MGTCELLAVAWDRASPELLREWAWAGRAPKRYTPTLMDSRALAVPTVWELISPHRRVGIVGIPLSFPPREVRGFWVLQWAQELIKGIEAEARVAIGLAGRYRPAAVVIHFQATDTVQHYLWGYPEVLSVFQAADLALAELLSALRPGWLILLSGHGMGPLEGEFHVKKGFLHLKRRPFLGELWFGTEIYRGEQAHLGPDLVFLSAGLRWMGKGLGGFLHHQAFSPLRRLPGTTWEGALLFSGEGVEAAEGLHGKLWDIAPTILSLLGVPIPDLLDARPLVEGFQSGFLWPEYVSEPVTSRQGYGGTPWTGFEGTGTCSYEDQ